MRADEELGRDCWYARSAPRTEHHAPLRTDVQCDVAIVGAGFAGLSAAIELAGRGFKVTVLEAREVGGGASGRNGGQVIHGLACDPLTIEAQLGQADARRVFDMSIEAIELIHERCARFAIDCDWQDGYLGVAVNAAKDRALQASADHLERHYGYSMRRVAAAEIDQWIASPRYAGAVHDPRSGHLHPLKYVLGLARAARSLGVTIHEHTAVTALEQGERPVLRCAGGATVRAGQVLLAGNVYLQGLAPALARRIMPVGTYIIATERLEPGVVEALIPSRSAVCDNNFVLDYFRPSRDDRLIFGGRASYSAITPRHMAESIRRRMVAVFPQLASARVAHAWGGFVDVTMNRAPDFGRLGGKVYYLQGFSGHGVALTGMAGRLVAEAMAGDASRFDVFARLKHRAFPGGPLLRTPALVLGMAWYRLRDALPI
ncbi:FAD-binding oxidoreductase [Pelomonas sp. KK5]|uniref:NAD(P)/FAD-dependent oxidoreductase n=1 Tax=Pelomonas sp. KK5 TaxID=1855730 RepID=UPI00097C6821|nr:FAD-binding oxidoreductase [Pelomonas sp. KK5]